MTNHFIDKNGTLYVESVAVNDIAKQYGTPVYIYSKAMLTEAFQQYAGAMAGYRHRICFAVKVNSNLSIMKLFADLGAGFDIVSGGELARVLAIGADPKLVVFSGVGKTEEEIVAALEVGIGCFNVESLEELKRIQMIAHQKGKVAPIAFRVNPDVDPKTHPYISTGMEKNKFGVDIPTAEKLYRMAKEMASIKIEGVSCHIGSQITETVPYLEAMDKLLAMTDRLAGEGIRLSHLDMGGGLGVCYRDETPPSISEFISAMLQRLAGRDLAFWVEPGRSLVGSAGILVTKVEYIKKTAKKQFVIVDAGMNDLMRPALYQAWHSIRAVDQTETPEIQCDIVGPVCESTDCFAEDRMLSVVSGANLAILTAGAYGEIMASNYNSRPRAASVMVDHDRIIQIRRRETMEDLFLNEKVGLIGG